MASGWTNKGRTELAQQPFAAADMRMLYVDTPPANQAAIDDINWVSEVVADELTGVTGYSRMTLAGESVTEDDAGNQAILDATDPTAQTLGAGGTIVGAFIFRFVAADATSPVWMYLECNDVITNGGLVTPAFHATLGLSTVTCEERAMSEGQAWVLLVEVGIIAFQSLLTLTRGLTK